MTLCTELSIPSPLGGREVPLAIHRCDSANIIINLPGANGSIGGYNNKYYTLANYLVEQNLGAVVRTDNKDSRQSPFGQLNNMSEVVDYALSNAESICGRTDPNIHLVGMSAGAATVCMLVPHYDQITKILLLAPANLGRPDLCESGLSKYKGTFAIAIGEDDTTVGVDSGEHFHKMAPLASEKKLYVIPSCDHAFRGELNGRILSQLPQWGFTKGAKLPSAANGCTLYI